MKPPERLPDAKAILPLTVDEADLLIAALEDWADAEAAADDGVAADVEMAEALVTRVQESLAYRAWRAKNAESRRERQERIEAQHRERKEARRTKNSIVWIVSGEDDITDEDVVVILP